MIEYPLDYKKNDAKSWLPTTVKEAKARDWDEIDIILFTGDAYVDHPAFGSAVIGRIIEKEGFRIAIVSQPNWKDDLRDFKKFGKPKHFFAVTSGNMDSMVNHYTANKRLRSNDAYTPDGKSGFRPDYCLKVYCEILKSIYPDSPIVIGGIEASLRRVVHYDYWNNSLMPSIIADTKADILVYGMGEKPLIEILKLTKKGVPLSNMTNINQTVIIRDEIPKMKNWTNIEISSYETCLKDKIEYAKNFKIVEQESNKHNARRIIQKHKNQYVIVNPPFATLTTEEIDSSYDLPYTMLPHYKYNKRGKIPAYEMIKFSVNTHRGCFGGCSFCTISAHQGKFIASRSEESIMKEVEKLSKHPEFKGYLSDIGGPSANMYKLEGKDLEICKKCVAPSCIHPVVCDNLNTNHQSMTNLYRKIDSLPYIKKAFVGSGIRYDLLVKDYNKKADNSIDEYMEQLLKNHVSGRLKVAPEHTSDNTLKIMRKPSFKYFKSFKEKFDRLNEKHKLKLQLIPYFISAHPDSNSEDMLNLALETKEMGFNLEQVQGFTPTPMTVATVIYYSGVHPYTLKPIYTAKTPKEKDRQHIFFFWYKKEMRTQIISELNKIGKSNFIDKLLNTRRDKKKD